MRKFVCRAVLALLCGLGAASAVHADRNLTVSPEPFYRFRVPSSRLGYLLTRDINEGYSLGYIFEGALTPYWGNPPAGLMPTPVGNYTIPVYRHRVNQRSTPYYYYSNGINYGTGYVYQGIAGYALPASGIYGGTPFYVWYSQDYGFWYTVNPYEAPPNGTYRFQGVPFNLFTQAGTQTVVAPDCDANQRQSCANLQGNWNDVTCACEAPADPCAPYYQNTCTQSGGTWNGGGCFCEYPDPCQVNPWSCQPCDSRFEICNVQ
ncbi:MAG: hypothetical protein ACJ76N_13790 [Thermoanaerobaculia bacterium]